MSTKHRRPHHHHHSSKAETRSHVMANVTNALSEDQKIAHRSQFLSFLAALTGTEVEVTLVDGQTFSGIFYTATPFNGKKYEIAIRAAKPLDKSGRVVANGSVEVGSTMVFPYDKVVSLKANKINSFDKRKGSAHVTDLDVDSSIKNQRRAGRGQDGRQLETVDASWLTSETAAAIDSKEPAKWDQFETNRRLYNVKSTYDENIYTKPLDRTAITREQMHHAERIAHEIENSYSSNVHMQEERGQLAQQDYDEEDMYSGVLRETDKKPGMKKIELQGQWRRGGPDVSAAASSPRTKKSGKSNNKSDAPPGLSVMPETQRFSPKAPSPAPQQPTPPPAATTPTPAVAAPSPTAVTPSAAAAPSPNTTAASPATVPSSSSTANASASTIPSPAPTETTTSAPAPAVATASASTEPAVTSEKPPATPTESKLNPNSKTFTLRATASEFKPTTLAGVPSAATTSPRNQDHHNHHHHQHHHKNRRHYPRGNPYDGMMYQQGYMPQDMYYPVYEVDPNMMMAPPQYYGAPMYYGDQMLPPPYMQNGMPPPPPYSYEHPLPPAPQAYSSPSTNPHSSPRSKSSPGNSRTVSGERHMDG